MAKKNETSAQIAERRRKGRIKAQKYRDRIKNDTNLYTLQQHAETQRYKERVASGKLKPIAAKSKREQRNQRKRWKCNSAKYRNKNINVSDDDNNTPSVSPNSNTQSVSPMVDQSFSSGSQSSRVRCGRKRVKRDRSKVYRALKQSAKEICVANLKAEKYKKRYQRLKAAMKKSSMNTPSPRSKVRTLLKGKNVGREIVRRLEFGESIVSQLKEKYRNTANRKQLRKFQQTVGTKYLKKYRMMSEARVFFKRQRICVGKKRLGALTEDMKQRVIQFLEDDEHSRMSPGKKDCVTRKGIKKQKRRLNFSMLELHEKFMRETDTKIAYSTFCRLRPFWVLQPTIADRDTCNCMIHDNMQFRVDKAYNLKIIPERSADDLPKIFCCDIVSEQCLLRKCTSCKSKTIPLLLEGGEDTLVFYMWVTGTETRSAHGKTFDVNITSKKVHTSTKNELIHSINKSANEKFLRHLCSIRHHYKAIKTLKQNLTEDVAIVHVDFSENYMCKYGTEVQAVHFGASHRQITLHTGIYYYLDVGTQQIKCQSFCTVSENNRHDACAIWAHLKPILLQIGKQIPNLKVLHFISDSPSTQYRNKTMFLLFTRFLPTIIPLEMSSWNYCEAGHGKGAADGVGGVIKRTADKLVAQGNDITDAATLIKYLQPKCPGVNLISIPGESIVRIDSMIPAGMKAIPGTMQVHQVTWHSSCRGELNVRSLSCFNCPFNENCPDYGLTPFRPVLIGELQKEQEDHADDEDGAVEEVSFSSEVGKKPLSEHYLISTGQWVAVIFSDEWYPGIVESADDGRLKVSFMARAGKDFKWPVPADKHYINSKDILCIMDGPHPVSSRLFSFSNLKQVEALMNE